MDEYFLGIEFRYPSQQIDPPMLWFKPENFKKVIAVCKEKGLGILVIEVYKEGYADTLLSDDFGGNPFDPNWYTNEFENAVKKYCLETENTEVLFAGWYLDPTDGNETAVTNNSKTMSVEASNNKPGLWSKIKNWF